MRGLRQEAGLGRIRIQIGALAGIFVTANSNPGRCRSAKRLLLTGQHTDLYTTRAPVVAAMMGGFKHHSLSRKLSEL
jgi:hypothetical protein